MQRRKRIRTERTHLFLPDAVIVMKAGIYQKKEALRQHYQEDNGKRELISGIMDAVLQASMANETLHSRLRMDRSGEVWYEEMEEAGTVCKVCEEQTDWKELVAREKQKPFDLKRGELLRCFLIPKDTCVEIVVLMHHLAGDGKSGVFFLRDVMTALNHHPLEKKPLVILNRRDFPWGTGMKRTARRLVRSLNRVWKREGTVFGKEEYRKVFTVYWEQNKQRFCERVFTSDETKQICSFAKAQGVTVHTLLTTAILKAYGDCTEVGYAVDVRKASQTGMGNFVSGQNFTAAYDHQYSFTENLRALQLSYQEKKQDRKSRYFTLRFLDRLTPTLIDAAVVQKYIGYDSEAGRMTAFLLGYDTVSDGISVSNLTRFHFGDADDSCRMEKLLFLPPMIPSDGRLFGAVTLEDRLGLTLHYREGEVDGETLFDAVVRILLEQCRSEK